MCITLFQQKKSYQLHRARIPNAALFVRSIVGILGWLHGTSRGGEIQLRRFRRLRRCFSSTKMKAHGDTTFTFLAFFSVAGFCNGAIFEPLLYYSCSLQTVILVVLLMLVTSRGVYRATCLPCGNGEAEESIQLRL